MIGEFKKDGFVIVDSVFSKEETAKLREITESFFSVSGNGFGNCDGVTQPGFIDFAHFSEMKNMIFSNPKILSTLKVVLGDEYRFCKHSDIAMNRQVGWHKDGLNGKYKIFEKTDPWKNNSDYRIVKTLIYLQDHADPSWQHALEVKKGSHLVNNLNDGESVFLRPALGSVIVFDQRLTHQARYKKINPNNRILITLGFGANNYYTDEFEQGTKARQDEQNMYRRQI